MIDFTPRLWRVLSAVTAMPRPSEGDDEHGASAVEYGLLVAGIAAIIVAAVFLFGEGIFNNLFQETCDSIAQNMPGGCT